jgi:Flp pilus assembly protein CpaB
VRRISPGTVTVGVLAIVLGLVAAYVARRSMEQKPPARDTVPVVVARVNLNANTRIRAEDLQVANVPRARSPEKALRTAAVAAGRVTKETIQAGQPVLEAQLWGIGESPALSERIPAGYRALTVNVVSPGSGLVRRDSLVDVALTVEGDLPTVGGLATKTLLSQVKVMEVGTRSTSRSRHSRAGQQADRRRAQRHAERFAVRHGGERRGGGQWPPRDPPRAVGAGSAGSRAAAVPRAEVERLVDANHRDRRRSRPRIDRRHRGRREARRRPVGPHALRPQRSRRTGQPGPVAGQADGGHVRDLADDGWKARPAGSRVPRPAGTMERATRPLCTDQCVS